MSELVQDELIVPVFSSGEAGLWADVSVATLGEESEVTAQFAELAEAGVEGEEPAVIVIEGEEARVVHETLVKRLQAVSFPIQDPETRVEFEDLRRALFQSEYTPA